MLSSSWIRPSKFSENNVHSGGLPKFQWLTEETTSSQVRPELLQKNILNQWVYVNLGYFLDLFLSTDSHYVIPYGSSWAFLGRGSWDELYPTFALFFSAKQCLLTNARNARYPYDPFSLCRGKTRIRIPLLAAVNLSVTWPTWTTYSCLANREGVATAWWFLVRAHEAMKQLPWESGSIWVLNPTFSYVFIIIAYYSMRE